MSERDNQRLPHVPSGNNGAEGSGTAAAEHDDATGRKRGKEGSSARKGRRMTKAASKHETANGIPISRDPGGTGSLGERQILEEVKFSDIEVRRKSATFFPLAKTVQPFVLSTFEP